jgi:hypothetical protein
MNASKTFKAFLSELRVASPSTEFSDFKEADIAEFEEQITPSILKVLLKDKTLFDEPFIVFGADISPLFADNSSLIWKNLQSCGIAAFLSGDIKEKLGKLTESLKGIWGGAGHSTDEIEKLLGSEESRSKISEILEFIMETRIARVVLRMVEEIDITDLGINFENPEDLIKTFQEGESNPAIEKVMRKIKTTLEDKVRRGEFTKEMLARDIEAIKMKVQVAFGDMFTDMVGGRKAAVPAQVILGNSPEARRARMIARLQRKLAERNTMD